MGKWKGALWWVAMVVSGCAGRDALLPPTVLVSPYDAAAGEVTWAVAPLANESGYSRLDTSEVADALTAAVDEVRGMSAVPHSRVLAAMAAKGMRGVQSPRDARELADALGVDGVVVGSVSAWDPYDPPKMGLTLALYVSPRGGAADADPLSLRGAYAEAAGRGTTFRDRPAAALSEHLDAANHEVLANLKEYARGRHEPGSALTWRRYTASMDQFTRFGAYWCVRGLLEREAGRVSGAASGAGTDSGGTSAKDRERD